MNNQSVTEISLRQFKLSNSEEIVCEVLDFGENDEESILVRNTLKLINVENPASGQRYYAFRPFMLYQGDGQHVQILNPGHIVGECTPTRALIEEYGKAVEDLNSDAQDNKLLSIDETRKAMEEYFSKMRDLKMELETDWEDSDSEIKFENIIKFPGSDNIH